ncbi:MAG: T9SS type A sorting domain-containing protein [Cytophagales bacterium]
MRLVLEDGLNSLNNSTSQKDNFRIASNGSSNPSLVSDLPFEFELIDMNGKLVTNGKSHGKTNLTNLNEGIYMVKFQTMNQTKMLKLSVTK